MKPETVGLTRVFVIVAGLFAALSAQADGQPPQGFVMTVYSDAAQGDKILGGSTAEAIEKLSAKQGARSKYLQAQVNLCVAYAQTKQLDLAVEACDSAIESSAKEARRIERAKRFGRDSERVANTGRAIALSNRGVLHALAGERQRAEQMFEMAVALQSNEASALANLAVLERRALATGS